LTRHVGDEPVAARVEATSPGVSPWICGTAGLTSALVVGVSTGLDAASCGLLAGMPIVAACMASGTVAAQGTAAARQAMHSYCGGLVPRIAFLVPVAGASPSLGWPVAMIMGLLGAAALGLAMSRARVQRSRAAPA
jgi:hypothetical protein